MSGRRGVVVILGFMMLAAAAYYGGLLDRIKDFSTDGDPWRLYEPLAAIERLTDPVRFFFGSGVGIPYWEGRTSITGDDDELGRVTINSSFDVHNGFLTLALKFGVPLAIWYTFAVFRALPKVKGRSILAIVIGLNILLSHGPIQMVEAVGLALGIQLVAYRGSRSIIRTTSGGKQC